MDRPRSSSSAQRLDGTPSEGSLQSPINAIYFPTRRLASPIDPHGKSTSAIPLARVEGQYQGHRSGKDRAPGGDQGYRVDLRRCPKAADVVSARLDARG